MRVALHRTESDCLKSIYDNVMTKEETLELVVPDVCADAGKILDVRGQLLLTGQKARANEVHIGASVEATVFYAAEDSGNIQYVLARIPFNITLPVNGAEDTSKLVSRFELCALDASLLNPRKLLLRAGISGRVACYAPDQFTLWDNLSEDVEAPVHILRKETEHTLAVGVREKSFVVSDEYRLPAGRDQGAKILSASTGLCVQDIKSVGNKLVVKAVSTTMAVFMNEADASLFDYAFSTQFSQIIEVDTYGEDLMHQVILLLRGAEFTSMQDRDNSRFCSASFQIVAQVISRKNLCSGYIADAYSNKFTLDTETANIKLMKGLPQNPVTLSLHGRLQNRSDICEIIYADVSALCAEPDSDGVNVSAKVSGIGKNDSGELIPIELRLNAEESLSLSRNQKASLLSIRRDRALITGTPQSAEFSVDVELGYMVVESDEINTVSGIELPEESPIKTDARPSLTVICSERDTDIWVLAKKYCSTVEIIEKANTVDGEFSVSHRPLLIPKAT
ncbi:MAG: DUF3794 domain-containing protein [Oscillospiraceae bacterium]|jgi:hypothetical protein|nr:DUF3794 domain-containing protein [Oscillospiraceae bacterium]